MQVDELMTESPVFVHGATPAHEAAVRAGEHGVHYLLVVDAEGDLRGITCLCDVGSADLKDPVGTFAHAPVTYVTSGQPAELAAQIMRDCGVGCLPVVREPGAVVGVLTRSDLRRAGVLGRESRNMVCAGCGSSHGLSAGEKRADGVVFCKACLESTPEPGTIARRWYCTLGDGD